jgi:thiol-disulfide isomerase/thioredoxin
MIFVAWVVALLVPPVGPPVQQSTGGVSTSIESRFSELAKEYDSKFAEWHRANISAKDRDEREKAAKALRPDPAAYSQRFLALAQEDPKSPTAFDALNRAILCGRGESANAAVDQLRRDWTNSPRMAEVTFPIGSSMSPNAENLLREVIAKNPDRKARGPAVLVLANLLEGYAAILMHRHESPEKAQLLERYYKKDHLERILTADSIALLGEIESLYAQALSEFGDVKLSPRASQTIGEFAQRRLDRLRVLAPGKPAPEIDGEDTDGKRFKLSEFRGKVVLLVFWASWCPPCLEQAKHELAITERLRGKSFVLLGVNIDHNEKLMRDAIAEHQITWRNWRAGHDDRIKARYGIQGIPLVLVLDPAGIIRAKDVHDEALDRAIDDLLKAANTEGAKAPRS